MAEIGGRDSAAAVAEKQINEKELGHGISRLQSAAAAFDKTADLELGASDSSTEAETDETSRAVSHAKVGRRAVAVHGLNRPLFHVDLTSALQSAVATIEARADDGRGHIASTS